jgi:predicted ATP-grasp superfamily ATP-dependent carboligase
MRALVTDAHYNHTLAAVRGLGKEGVEVTAASEHKHSVSFYSKYCKHSLVYPSPLKAPDKFVKFLLEEVRKNRYDVLMPISLHATRLLSKHRDSFSKFVKIPIVDYATFMKAYDKYETIKIARKAGVGCPDTIIPRDASEVRSISEKINYPVVLKTDKEGGQISYAKNPQELMEKYKRFDLKFKGLKEDYRYMLQEYIPGKVFGFFALFNNGEPRATFVHKRIREYPIDGGPSTLRESVKNPAIERAGIKMLKALKWHGVAMVEFKIDSRDGKPKLMEVNPKFWGSLALPIAAGMNFPYLLYKMAVCGDIRPESSYKVGVKSRWMLGDMMHALSYLNSSKPNKLGMLNEFMKFRGMHYDDLSIDDPIPMLAEFAGSIARAIR